MLSKLIVSSFSAMLEIAIWIILLLAFLGGWAGANFFGGLLAILLAFLVCVIVFGSLFTLIDIQKTLRTIEEKQKSSP